MAVKSMKFQSNLRLPEETKTEKEKATIKSKNASKGLTIIYSLQVSLDFDKAPKIAQNLFQVYEYCRVQIIDFALKGTVEKLATAIEFVQTILEGWEGIRSEVS